MICDGTLAHEEPFSGQTAGSYFKLNLDNSISIDSADGTPPEYKRQDGAAAVGNGRAIQNKSSPLIKSVGVPYPRLETSACIEAKSI